MEILNPQVLSELSNLGAAGAVIVITALFLWHIDKQNKNLEAHSKAASQDFERDLTRVVDSAQILNNTLAEANIRLVEAVDHKIDAVVHRTDQIIHQNTKIEEMLVMHLKSND